MYNIYIHTLYILYICRGSSFSAHATFLSWQKRLGMHHKGTNSVVKALLRRW